MDATDVFKDSDSFIHWFLIAALANIELTEKMKEYPRLITMQINGEEMDPMRAINRLEEEFEKQVEKKALELVEKLKLDVLTPYEVKVEELTNHLDEQLEKLIKAELPNTQESN